MTIDEFEKRLNALKEEINNDASQEIALLLETEAMQFINSNFRNQGWEGARWEESTGTILVKSGRLRGGFETEKTAGQVAVRNYAPYAQAHNEGLSGTASVRAHTRARQSGSRGKKRILSVAQVRAHTRAYKFKKRQFAPCDGNDSPTLAENVKMALEKHIQTLFEKHRLT